MIILYYKEFSNILGRDMEYKVYGTGGVPVIAFSDSGGRFYQFEDEGILDGFSKDLDTQTFQLFTVDELGSEIWKTETRDDIVHKYFKYITDEFIPKVYEINNTKTRSMILLGVGVGGYYASNIFFTNPKFAKGLISLSGYYSTRFININDSSISPIDYLKDMDDPERISLYRDSIIIMCAGRGAMEETSLQETKNIENVLKNKNIDAFVDYWGYDVSHDWFWWRKQISYFMGKVKERLNTNSS
ncbi:MAG: hypothetical protein LBI03_04815 [Clostridiales bacterium]|jgi:esterase/lipase superfamily enzyme|nr:hypothetical protein [Clostridiales bacterium]